MEKLSQRLKEGCGEGEKLPFSILIKFYKGSWIHLHKKRFFYVFCSDMYRLLSGENPRSDHPWDSSSRTMVLQYTRGRLNEVFVEMKNVMIKLITDSDGDLWIDGGRWGEDGRHHAWRQTQTKIRKEENSLIQQRLLILMLFSDTHSTSWLKVCGHQNTAKQRKGIECAYKPSW